MDGTEASLRVLTQPASETYDETVFETSSIYNEAAPDPWVAFMIGGIFSVLGFILWIRRVLRLKESVGGVFSGSLRIRAWLSAFIDNDDPTYTIVKMAAQSFLFLGGLQYNYELTFSVMLGYFAVESCADSFRVLLAFSEADSVQDVVVTSESIRMSMRKQGATQLKPSNVYEDLSREKTIVIMVFITQCLLIGFVVSDIFRAETHTCPDGTKNCPVVGTLGSWGLYILGIFMACVFLLGPKTNFGQSEQNPAYWLQLLLTAKQTGSKCTWYDPTDDMTKTRILKPSDWRLWLRFFMSFLINGVGFHILVHALPIQVAAQSTLTGVVFRAVGMMYLVDLDDTPGYTLTLVAEDEGKKQDEEEIAPQDVAEQSEVATSADEIIANARAQLDALAASQGVVTTQPSKRFPGALVMAGGVTATVAFAGSTKREKEGQGGLETAGSGGAEEDGGADGGEDGGGANGGADV